MLDIWNLLRKYNHIPVVSENIRCGTKADLMLLIAAYFCNKSALFDQNSTFTQRNNMRAVLEIF